MQNTVERTLTALKGRCDQAEVFAYESESTPVDFEDSSLKTITSRQSQGLAVRVVREGRIGFASTTDLRNPVRCVDMAVENAAFGDEAKFEFPRTAAAADPAINDAQTAALSAEELVDMGSVFVEALREEDEQFRSLAHLNSARERVTIANTNGLSAQYEATRFELYVGGQLVEGENILWLYEGYSLRKMGPSIEELTARVIDDLRIARHNVSVQSGTYPVLFSPGALIYLLMPVLACLDGKAVVRGLSPWKDRLGEEVLSPKLTLVDDGLMPYGPGTAPFDDEGTPAQRTVLVREGVIDAFLTDLNTAAALGTSSTGNAVREGIGSPPIPRPANPVLTPGSRESQDILSDIELGLYVKDLMGAWAGNPYSGEVSGNISLGYLVRKGKPVGRVKNAMLSLNVFEALKHQLLELSSDRDWSMQAFVPHALIDGVSVSVKT